MLAAVIQDLAQISPPERPEEVMGWCGEISKRALTIAVAMAAETLELTDTNKMRLISSAQRKPFRKSDDEPPTTGQLDDRLAEMLKNWMALVSRDVRETNGHKTKAR